MIQAIPRRPIVAAAAAAAIFLGGCTSLHDYVHNGFKVGPNCCPPSAPVAEHWIDEADVCPQRDPVLLNRWWAVFVDPVLHERDPVLECLINNAYQQNLTLKEAGFRILQARARRAIAVGNLFPQQQQATGGFSRNVVPGLNFFDQWQYGFNLSWELDFWGRYRRTVAFYDNTLQASVWDYNSAVVTLLGDVGQTYLRIRTDQEQIRLARENIEIQQKVADFFEQRAAVSYGTNVRLDYDQTQSVLATTKSQVPQLEIDLRQANDELCVLLGMPSVDLREVMPLWKAVDQRKAEEWNRRRLETTRKVEALLDKWDRGLPLKPEDLITSHRPETIYLPIVPPARQMAIGIPADLLRNRPDVRRAERLAMAQAEQIGIALSDLYPAIFINGSLGYTANNFPDLFASNAMTGSAGPSFQWNLLNYGRIVNNARLQDALLQELLVAYQQTALAADQEVEDGLVTFVLSHERANLLAESVMRSRDAVVYVTFQKEKGQIDVNRYATVAQNLVTQENLWALAQGNISQGLVAVYRALGGGWEIPPDQQVPLPEVMPGAANHGEPIPAPPAEMPNGAAAVPIAPQPLPDQPPARPPAQPNAGP
jgi:outer membrane protein TolC